MCSSLSTNKRHSRISLSNNELYNEILTKLPSNFALKTIRKKEKNLQMVMIKIIQTSMIIKIIQTMMIIKIIQTRMIIKIIQMRMIIKIIIQTMTIMMMKNGMVGMKFIILGHQRLLRFQKRK